MTDLDRTKWHRRATAKEMQAACGRFNAKHKVGDEVRYWTGLREGEGKVGAIRFPAAIMGGHTPVVYIAGAGAVALSHVEQAHD